MLKGKKLNLPDRLGSLLAGFEDKDGDSGGSGSALDLGEELEIIQPNRFRSGRESESDDEDGEVQEEAMVKRKLEVDEELEHHGRQPRHQNGSDHISVVKTIEDDEKRSDIEYEISQKMINVGKLQRIVGTGLPDGGNLRPTVWKLLLGYLPPSRDLWEKELIENRQKYAKLKEELLLTPSELARIKEEALHSNEHNNADSGTDGPLIRHEISHEDHPLSLGKASVWHQYFEHIDIAEQIDRDLQRTHPEMKFFSGESSFSRRHRVCLFASYIHGINEEYSPPISKLNPAIRYVQGMNEVLAPIYYVFSTDTDVQNASNAEADSFACFVLLLKLLKANDEELWRHLEFTTKATSVLCIPVDNIATYSRIQSPINPKNLDSLLSNPFGVQEMLLRVCCAMLLCAKSRLLSGDFAANLRLLQHYPDIDIEHLLKPLELVVSDVWGPAPVYSNGFRYYVAFIDAHSRQVERQFDVKLKVFQPDGGSEFGVLQAYMKEQGIVHRMSCPHTSEQNGLVERKYRQIVEVVFLC
ncbi:Ypt/Rab-GAP domain of gyp1p superfamily protein isoform 2 [Hibiscus syriacus]|uniref:Ypt/Rab-GAP domain of gyp1p superfamily protein isoform 2 n=1 Tax=Hibiscus syriacus TaxID=106335 RepID=A0A6A3BDU5_HIBSY|nr:Ypt/Rab-GAP domain of gyp1p superfamily protein isoform 2 [Hibiscus syriacus]